VDVGVADAAVEDVDEDVVGAGFAARDGEGGETTFAIAWLGEGPSAAGTPKKSGGGAKPSTSMR
jgi:hypothetical protein